jgi:RNA recognition motif-containing protein
LPSGLDKEVSTRETRSHAIFVRHFPPATTESDLRLVFESFGAVAEDGVTLRASKTQKSETTIEKHAFIEFVDKKGFDEALRFAATSEVLVLGAAVGVEEKREKPPARRDRGDGTNKSGADERGAEAHRREARGGDRERRAPRKNQTGGARVGGREGEAGRREGGAGRARGRVDKR